ncbi:MAG: Cys-tRNA(Pro) deacylase [Oscillospiraceae bacterium]|nr:Cys-tRNA(Pro) deacylase [Oscillospiraceae bacterium]
MRQFERKKLSYTIHSYEGVISGVDVARTLGQDPRRVFKTLVTVGKSGGHYVFMIPVEQELDLKKAAKAVGEKSVAMLPQKDLLPLTGYIHGGCSPVGMKKQFPTVLHSSVMDFETIFFSGGKIGLQICSDPRNLEKLIPLTYHSVTTEEL